jgi:hypothetical protein
VQVFGADISTILPPDIAQTKQDVPRQEKTIIVGMDRARSNSN